MKEQEIEVMSEKEEKIADILRRLDFDKSTAKTLVYMMNKRTAHAVDIERSTDLRQPEVSNATMKLRELGILFTRNKPKKGKGRPRFVYILSKPVSEIKDFISKRAQDRIERREKDIKALETTKIWYSQHPVVPKS